MRHDEATQAGSLGATLAARLKSITRPSAPIDKGPTCGTCDDTCGWLYPNGPDGGVVPCPECQSRKRGQAPGLPIAEHGSRMATFKPTTDNKHAIAAAQQWLDGKRQDLYLFGGVGTGKTRLACSLANERWAAMEQVEFFRVAHLLASMQPNATSDVDATLGRIERIPVIVLDDVGASQATDFARRMLLVLYESRMDRGHRTIWTSNLDLEELAGFNRDERLSSRIAGNALIAEMTGKDWRLKVRP